ncbi:MAG: T9SS type A sorting domain-containing protein, partial [Candidatus Latescibacteria bacterium]|nr:T9SS type A sorting domain-containing protein [Candidatus Latescibacterota bacterium]
PKPTAPAPASPPPLPLPSPAPASSFLALEDNGLGIPPDTYGTVGPDHLMVTLNTQVRIQDRAGGEISTVFSEDFWAPLGPFDLIGGFDPKVLYDPYENRWIYVALADPFSPTSSILIGVTQDGNPTGVWNLYRVDADPDDIVWADNPKVGFNKDWVVVQTNMFPLPESEGSFQSNFYVFDKADLYEEGDGQFTLLEDTTGSDQAPVTTYDPALSTMYLIETWSGNLDGAEYLRLSTITGPVGAEELTLGVAFPTTPETWDYIPPNYENFGPQLGSPEKIELGDGRIHSAVYRNGSVWCTHTVFLPASEDRNSATRSAVEWWQMSPEGAVLQRGRIDDPTGFNFYAYPSIAVNQYNDVLIGYSRFSAFQYPSGNYAFRAWNDPPSALRQDTVLKAGEAPYFKDFGSGRNRWGDYSNTVIDPTDDTGFWTIQEYAATPNPFDPFGFPDRWGTWWGHILPGGPAPGVIAFSDAFARPGGQAVVDVVVESNQDIAGLQFKIQPYCDGDPTWLAHFNGLINDLEQAGWTATSHTDENGVTTILFFNTNGGSLPSGQHHKILELIFDIALDTPFGKWIDLVTWDVILSDPDSRPIPVNLELGTIHIGHPGDIAGGQLGGGDGEADILDIIKLIKKILGLLPQPEWGSFDFFLCDVNGDGYINILDLVGLIREVLDSGQSDGKVIADGPTSPVTVSLGNVQTLTGNLLAVPVTLSANGTVAGLQATVTFDAAHLQLGTPQLVGAAAGMTVQSQVVDGTLRVLIYSATGQVIPAGAGPTLIIPVTLLGAGTPELRLSEVLLADRGAQAIPVTVGTSTVKVAPLPTAFGLKGARPNPFNPTTRLAYNVPQTAQIVVAVYNLVGQEVVRLVDAEQQPGRYEVVWAGRNAQGLSVASGVYLYRLTSSTGFSQTKRMTLVK